MASGRIPAIDNLRAVLIICVVAGHLMEFIRFENCEELYTLIYMFHMPAFAFVSGMCCKSAEPSAKRLLSDILYPYVVFQLLYKFVSNTVWGVEEGYQITTPYWILWYLASMFFWQLLLFMMNAVSRRWPAMVIVTAMALLAGCVTSINYFLSMSRTLVMFPFFLGGFYLREHRDAFLEIFSNRKLLALLLRLAAIAAGVGLSVVAFNSVGKITPNALYCSMPYEWDAGNMGIRALLAVVAWLWIAVLCIMIPKINVPVLTHIGRNTMPVFLLHGFVMRGLMYNGHLLDGLPRQQTVLALSLAIPFLLSLKPVVFLSRPFMRWPFGKGKLKTALK
jgi:fucose 4-O-acetylase-like acetyltransferase